MNESLSAPPMLPREGPTEAAPRVVLQVANLGKRYHLYENPRERLKQALWRGRRSYGRQFWALRGISFEVKQGEAVGIIGRNGAGKSTLLQLISGTIPPTEGQLVSRGRVAALLELGSGFDYEATGRENIFLAGGIYGFSHRQMEKRFDEIVAFADIGQFLEQPVKFYSSGMFSRLAFAVQTHVDPDLLIVDEILAVGDIKFQQKCLARIRQMCEGGMSLLLVSHSIGHVQALCDWAVLVENGRLIARGSPDYIWDVYHRRMFEEDVAKHVRGATVPQGEQTGRESQPERRYIVANREPVGDPEATELDAIGMGYRESETFLADVEKTRFGTGEVRIVTTEILSSDGLPAQVAHLNQDVRYRVHLRVDRPIPSLIIGFQVKDNRGQCIYSTETDAEGMDLMPLSPGDTVVCEFLFPADLFPGSYTLTPGCCSVENKLQKTAVYYDWIEACDVLQIAMPHSKAVYSLYYRPIPITVAVTRPAAEAAPTDEPQAAER